MRHRGDYSGGFLDDSQTSSLQRQVDNQREVTEEKDKEVRGQSLVKVKLVYFLGIFDPGKLNKSRQLVQPLLKNCILCWE